MSCEGSTPILLAHTKPMSISSSFTTLSCKYPPNCTVKEMGFLKKQNQQIFDYIEIDTLRGSQRARLADKVKKEAEKILRKLRNFMDYVEKEQQIIGQKRKKLRMKQAAKGRKLRNCFVQKVPILKNIMYDLKIEYQDLEGNYVSLILVDLMHVLEFVNGFLAEDLLFVVTLRDSYIKHKFTNFANTSDGMKLTEDIKRVKRRYQQVKLAEKQLNLQRVVKSALEICAKAFSPRLSYFKDIGAAEAVIYYAAEKIMQNPSYWQIAASNVMNFPSDSGRFLLKSSKEFAAKANVMEEDSMKYIFLLFARNTFSELYGHSIYPAIKTCSTNEKWEKARFLRRYPARYFGVPSRFLPPLISSVPLEGFPRGTEYDEALALVRGLTYAVCPVDFAQAAFSALSAIEAAACACSRAAEVRETGRVVVALGEHKLCFDELLDVSTVVVLAADPADVGGLIDAFGPYVDGLMMPSELDFAFANMRMLWAHITSIDVDAFVARSKVLEDTFEDDPLGIATR